MAIQGTTNFSNLAVDGTVTAGTISATVLSATGAAIPKVIAATVGHSSFTNGTTVGTYALPGTIPAGAVFYWTAVTAIGQGFQGSPNATATMVIGDGTDADRYTGTAGINVFTTAAGGADAGTPSGVLAHTAAKTPVLTITPGSVWGSITAGTVSVRLYYFE